MLVFRHLWVGHKICINICMRCHVETFSGNVVGGGAWWQQVFFFIDLLPGFRYGSRSRYVIKEGYNEYSFSLARCCERGGDTKGREYSFLLTRGGAFWMTACVCESSVRLVFFFIDLVVGIWSGVQGEVRVCVRA